jgi:hypothetical protein
MTPGLSMSSRQPTSVDDLSPGMVLGENVQDSQGRLLMPVGTELTERHLRAFQLWGIMSVRVRGADGEEPGAPEVSPEALTAARDRVLPRFVHNDIHHPLIAALLDLCVRREARRAAGGDHG